MNLPNAVLDLQATIYSMPQAPFTLAISEAPGPFPCCTFGTWLPGLVSFPRMGKYHLGQAPVPVIDGLGVFGGASLLAVANSGSIQLFGSLPLNSPDHITIQALVPDATSSVGVSFTAAFASVKFQ